VSVLIYKKRLRPRCPVVFFVIYLNDNEKRSETRPARPRFRNPLVDLEMVPVVYEATTIAHHPPQVFVATMVVGTCGVFDIYFWRNTPSALPTIVLEYLKANVGSSCLLSEGQPPHGAPSVPLFCASFPCKTARFKESIGADETEELGPLWLELLSLRLSLYTF
jgi:hypothetical protein